VLFANMLPMLAFQKFHQKIVFTLARGCFCRGRWGDAMTGWHQERRARGAVRWALLWRVICLLAYRAIVTIC